MLILFVVMLTACGNDESPSGASSVPSAAPATGGAAAPATSAASAAPATASGALPVDLLKAVTSAVGVSSVYRERTQDVHLLVDGKLDTAWNSRTGDLVGAWIEVRLPDGVRVSSMEMTVGFTKEGGRIDLFTGNHRVSRVRVLHEGQPVGEYPLDPESRALQSVPVAGGGGRWRVEVVAVLPGSRPDWREICVSELRVMGETGTADTSSPGAFTAVGPTPDLAQALANEPTEQEAELIIAITELDEEWSGFERMRRRGATLSDFAARRAAFYDHVADAIAPADASRAARLREMARHAPSAVSSGALDEAIAAMQVAVDASHDDEARCSWAETGFTIALNRINDDLDGELRGEPRQAAETLWEDQGGRGPRPSAAEFDRREAAAEALSTALDDLDELSVEHSAQAARRVQRMSTPTLEVAAEGWPTLLRWAGDVASRCTR